MKSWKSPFSGKDLDQEELRTEVAANVVSKQHILRTCGYPEAKVTLARDRDGVIMQCEEAHFSNLIPFPSELRSFFIEAFAVTYETLRFEYGFDTLVLPVDMPSAEKLGALLRHFESLRTLIFVTTGRDWAPGRVFFMRDEPPQLIADLEKAGITYFIPFRDDALVFTGRGEMPDPLLIKGYAGTGAFKSATVSECEIIAAALLDNDSVQCDQMFQAEESYQMNSWVSNISQLGNYFKRFDTTTPSFPS